MTQISTEASEIERVLSSLPARKPISHSSLAGAYGADRVAAAYCGISYYGKPPPGEWQHGWGQERLSFHPAAVIGGWGSYESVKATECFWVARKDQEALLRAHGYRFARAIGIPITYLQKSAALRVRGSLLVMPVHSLDTTAHRWNFEDYVNHIAAIRHRFSTVVVCVHPFCKEKGYWYPEFERRGFRIIEGASGPDSNSLFRMQRLFEAFEFVTTNGYGSHLVYSAYLGTKTSVFGPFAELRAEDFRETPLYRDVPEILLPTLEACSEEILRQDYPFLFVEPHQALTHVDWAAKEAGADCRPSPSELRKLFKWTAADRLRVKVARIAGRARSLPRRIKGRAIRSFGFLGTKPGLGD